MGSESVGFDNLYTETKNRHEEEFNFIVERIIKNLTYTLNESLSTINDSASIVGDIEAQMRTKLDAELHNRLESFEENMYSFYQRLVNAVRPSLEFCQPGDRDCFEDLSAFVVGELAKQAEENESHNEEANVEGKVVVDNGAETRVDAAVVNEIADISVANESENHSESSAQEQESASQETNAGQTAQVEGEATNAEAAETGETAGATDAQETTETTASSEGQVSTEAEVSTESTQTAEPTAAVAVAQTSTQALSSSKIHDDEMTNLISGLGSTETGSDTLDNLVNNHNTQNNKSNQGQQNNNNNGQQAQSNDNSHGNNQQAQKNSHGNNQQAQSNNHDNNQQAQSNQSGNASQNNQAADNTQRATGLAAMNTFSISKALYAEALTAYRKNNSTSHRKISKFANMKKMPIFN